MPLALLIRYDFQQPPPGFTRNAILIGIAMAFTQLLVGLAFRLYLGRFRFASFDEVFGVVTSAVLVGFIYSAVALVLNLEYVSGPRPRSPPDWPSSGCWPEGLPFGCGGNASPPTFAKATAP